MLLRFSLNLGEEADALRGQSQMCSTGYRTADLMEQGKTAVNTVEMADLIIEKIAVGEALA
jgi:3-isopropylmalate dehydrogenase